MRVLFSVLLTFVVMVFYMMIVPASGQAVLGLIVVVILTFCVLYLDVFGPPRGED